MKREKKIVIIAGPNGAGKTIFAREFLPNEMGWCNFQRQFKLLVDAWAHYDNSGERPELVEQGNNV
jgi:predicted ABC-type ATPase